MGRGQLLVPGVCSCCSVSFSGVASRFRAGDREEGFFLPFAADAADDDDDDDDEPDDEERGMAAE